MKVCELVEKLGLKVLNLADGDREVTGGYCGDLLSWVMGRAEADTALMTIMSNINVIAVATLADVSCVILTEDVEMEDEVLKTAEEKGVNVLSSSKNTYETAVMLSKVI